MDTPNLFNAPKIKFHPREHSRSPSRSPHRSPTRQRITEDILSDLSPATTLEAFTSASPSGKLRASVEAATPSERAFGIRATLASKKIQEWVGELADWPWPKGAGSGGFEMPAAKRRKLDGSDFRQSRNGHPDNGTEEMADVAYMGSLPAQDVLTYETRLDEIQEDMEDLDVEGIKSNILNTHIAPRSRPSSRSSSLGINNTGPSTSLMPYAKMDDFTAIVTATVLQCLPYLNRLNKLMDVWSIRLVVLRKVPPLLELLDDAEIALQSGWQAIQIQGAKDTPEEFLDRKTFDVMRNILQDKVKVLGQELDYMLDTLEGREDTLPDLWLDRMEKIEVNYGEWVVRGDRKVWEGEWAQMAKIQAEEEERLKAERAAEKAAKQEADMIKKEEEDRLMAEESARESARLLEIRIKQEQCDKQRAEEVAREAARLEAARIKQAKDDQSKAKEDARLRDEEVREATEARIEKDIKGRLNAEAEAAEVDRLEAYKLKKEEERQLRFEIDEIQRLKNEDHKRLRLEAEDAKLKVDHTRVARKDGSKLEQEEIAEATQLENENASRNLDVALQTRPEAPERVVELGQDLKAEEAPVAPVDPDICLDLDHNPSGKRKSRPVIPKLLKGAAAGLARVVRRKPTTNGADGEEESEEEAAPSSPVQGMDGSSESKVDASKFGLPRKFDKSISVNSQSKRRSLVTLQDSTDRPGVPPTHSLPSNPFDEPDSPPELPTSAVDEISGQNFEQTPSPIVLNEHSTKPFISLPGIPSQEAKAVSDTSLGSQPTVISKPFTPPSLESHKETEDHAMQPSIPLPIDEATIIIPSNEDEYDTLNSQPSSHDRNLSVVSSYSASDPSPELHQPESTEFFRPVLSPIKSARSYEPSSEPTTPSKPSPDRPDVLPSVEIPTILDPQEHLNPNDFQDATNESPSLEEAFSQNGDGAQEHKLGEVPADYIEPSTFVRDTSVISTISRPSSSASNNSTIITRHIADSTLSPDVPSSPVSTTDPLEPFPDIEESPSAGRIGHRHASSREYSPPESPPLPAISKLQLLNSPNLIPSSPLETPITPTSDTPNFPLLDISSAPLSSPKKSTTTDDQLQTQISTILESIPAKIRLTSEPDTENNPLSPSQKDSLHPRKTRRSLTPSIRSSSSMSMRAPTPSFTLAPAYGKSGPRPRHQSSNPEIKLYHLSRSTGEAPIKLFVRLVGENGERVMVRVGGGWADLGEYLREYASHHGRRVVSGNAEDDKVEIQDLPSRVVSGTKNSNGNGRASPIPPRPNSVLERERPMSSLYIRKTRKSVGEQSESKMMNSSPSTPFTPNNDSPRDGPGSNRSVSRLSWTEEESSLGLAGPKSKSKVISERDQEWVESMKEKVRLASAEKEKRKEGGGRKSFGEMEKVGGTKRLFKKSG